MFLFLFLFLFFVLIKFRANQHPMNSYFNIVNYIDIVLLILNIYILLIIIYLKYTTRKSEVDNKASEKLSYYTKLLH